MQRKRVVVRTGADDVCVSLDLPDATTAGAPSTVNTPENLRGGFKSGSSELVTGSSESGSDEETHPPVVTAPSPRLGSGRASEQASIHEDIEDTLAELAKRAKRPVVGSRRLPAWGPAGEGLNIASGAVSSDLLARLQQSGNAKRVPVQQPLFDNAGDDVIKFSRDDDTAKHDHDTSDTDSSQSDVSERSLKRRRREKIDRDFDQAMSGSDDDDDEESVDGSGDGDGDDSGWESSDSDSDGSSTSSASSIPNADDAAVAQVPEAPRQAVTRGFGAGRLAAVAPPPIPGASTRAHYAGLTFETLYNASGCFHQVMLGITKPQTIQGPCTIYGIFGETSCGGFLLGKKCISIASKRRVVLQPMQKLTSAASKLSAGEFRDLVTRSSSCLPESVVKPWQPEENKDSQTAYLQSTSDHLIDWEWVSSTLQNWLARLSSNRSGTSVVLVLQPHVTGERPMRRVTFKTKGDNHVDRFGGEDFMHLPVCISTHHMHPDVEPALIPVFRRVVSGSFSVAVVGGQNIGKSTLARAFANAWFSQLGVCYWVDFDVGRPEFAMSGTISVCQIVRPIKGPNDFGAARIIKVLHLGGSRTHCPQTTAWAVAELCDFVNEHHKSWLRPIVINTHGWIESTGRRITVEALRRLNPQHVVQLLRHGDPKWVIPEIIYDPKCGLNRRVCAERFLNGLPLELPEAMGSRNYAPTSEVASAPASSTAMLVHSLPVVRLEVKHKAAMSRRDNWRWYFQCLTGLRRVTRNSSDQVGPTGALQLISADTTRISVGLNGPRVILAHPQAKELRVSVQDFADAVVGCVIAVGIAESDVATPDDSPHASAVVSHPADLLCSKGTTKLHRVSGYAFVDSHDAATHSLTLRIPAPPCAVRDALHHTIVDGRDRIVLIACPLEWFDTSFLAEEMASFERTQ